MKKVLMIFGAVLLTQTSCDLKPKIVSLPDSVGDFISSRYPALLADPNVNPEIYNSAVTDYGVYASPDLYGTDVNDDYVLYASLDDYIVPDVKSDDDVKAIKQKDTEFVQDYNVTDDDYLIVPMYGTQKDADNSHDEVIVVAAGDTLYGLAKKYGVTTEYLASVNNIESPYTLEIGQKLKIGEMTADATNVVDDVLQVAKPKSSVRAATKVELKDITVSQGETLYSLSRKYSMPVNDLAVINNLKPPFTLAVGQKLRVPDFENVKQVNVKRNQNEISEKYKKTAVYNQEKISHRNEKKQLDISESKKDIKPVKKISSDPSKKLPKINARSSSKFSWPVRGKILSNYGAKSNGLFNDGINISAVSGSAVKAAENGVVAYAGNEVKGMGNLVIVQHSGGWMTVYAHMDSMSVRRGASVKVGQKIGTVGETGKVDSPQLHFEIRKGTKAYNPISYLKK